MKLHELDDLIEHCLEGRLNEADAARLSAALQASPEARTRYWEAASIHGLLEHTMQQASLRVITGQASPKVTRWLQWRPLAAAAAGLVLGIFCTSVVLAYVRPALEKTVTLLEDGFESGEAPLVTGVPTVEGRWSGDYTEVVEAQQGVQPEDGKKMLRFLRGDYGGKTNAAGSHVADIYRLIDVRPYRHEFADGSIVVQLSAAFNAFEFPRGETYQRKMTIHAFDAETATNGSLRVVSTWDDSCLATASAGPMKMDRNPASWQRLTCDLRVPADTALLLIHIMNPAGLRTQPEKGFAGHYLDSVHLTMTRRPPQ